MPLAELVPMRAGSFGTEVPQDDAGFKRHFRLRHHREVRSIPMKQLRSPRRFKAAISLAGAVLILFASTLFAQTAAASRRHHAGNSLVSGTMAGVAMGR